MRYALAACWVDPQIPMICRPIPLYASYMVHSRIIDELIARDPDRVRADLEAIQREKAALEAEETLLNQVLAIQGMRNGDDKQASADLATPDAVYQVKRSRQGPSISAEVLNVMRADAGTWLTYNDVHERLRARDVHASRNAMRVALRRWVERNELEHDSEGRFRLRRELASEGNR